MSDRVDFEVVCPNNHEQTLSFSETEFEEALKSGDLVLHCNTCDTNWPPSAEDIAKIRKRFAEDKD
jgi:hypothetical protein